MGLLHSVVWCLGVTLCVIKCIWMWAMELNQSLLQCKLQLNYAN